MVRHDRNEFLIGLCLRAAALAAVAISTPTVGFSAMAASSQTSTAAPAPQEVFPSPDGAIEALIAANRGNQLAALRRILGPAAAKLIQSGDAVADRNGRVRFVAAYDEAHRIELQGSDKAVLIVGMEDWPLPIPLIRERSGWRFDTKAGEQEILDRRIGRNELNVIEVCREYVQAQREYAAMNASGGAKPEYAQHIMSREGKHDGLSWAAKPGEKDSPLGPLIAQARAAGYVTDAPRSKSQPYHGYYFRILTRQGPHAPGGAKHYIVGGHMTGGFGLLAYPAVYGDSGVMTFIVDQDGIVFERNLGRQTESIARRIEQYDPDGTWRAP
jgi:hypothetical protein